MKLTTVQRLIALAILFTLLGMCKSKGQDTLKIPMQTITGAIQDKQYQIEQILAGKDKGNVYFYQGQLDMLNAFHQIGVSQAKDTVKVKTDTTGVK